MEQIFTELNQCIELHNSTDPDSLILDGTRMEANTSRMIFVWMKSTSKYRASAWKKLMIQNKGTFGQLNNALFK